MHKTRGRSCPVRVRIFLCVFVILSFLLCVSPATVRAISFDARKIAMGETLLPYYGESSILNPAYLDIEENTPFTIPVPIGLIVFLSDLPSFNPDDKDFDAVRLASLMMNPPFYLELVSRDSNDSTNIQLDVAKDKLMVDLDNLQQYVPSGTVDVGLFDFRQPRVGFSIRHVHLSLSPFVLMEGDFKPSDNLERALSQAEPFTPNTEYSVRSTGTTNIGAAFNVGHAWNLQDHFKALRDSPQVLAGINAKYIMGFVYGDVVNESKLRTSDPIFDDVNPPEVTVSTSLDYAYPESGDIGPKGNGVGFDLGVLLRYPTLDIGLGIQDIYTYLNWRVNREQYEFNDLTNTMIKSVIAEDENIQAHVPRTFALSAAYRRMEDAGWCSDRVQGDYIIASNFEVVGGDVFMRVGGETYYGPGPIAIRMGTFNQGDKLQGSFGLGIPLKIFDFDIALSTHSRTFQKKRGVTLATSISFH